MQHNIKHIFYFSHMNNLLYYNIIYKSNDHSLVVDTKKNSSEYRSLALRKHRVVNRKKSLTMR